MGYRSDIKLITTPEGWSQIDKAVRKASGVTDKNENTSYVLTHSTHATPILNGRYVLGEWDDIKWYEGYDDDVTAFMTALGQLDASDIPYNYIRLGEDDADIDRRYNNCGVLSEYADMPNLWVKREIVVEY